jgi:cytidyltransferase-like protein
VGHVDIVNRASSMFDEIIIAIGVNTKKTTLFDLEKRKELQKTFPYNPTLLVNPGSVFGLKVVPEKEADKIRSAMNVLDDPRLASYCFRIS